MPEYLHPGVYVEEVPSGSRPIDGVETSTAAFAGVANAGALGASPLLTSLRDFEQLYGDSTDVTFPDGSCQLNYLWHAVRAFFENGGKKLYVSRVEAPATAGFAAALARLVDVPEIAIVAAPGSTARSPQVQLSDVEARYHALLLHAEVTRRFAILDSADQQSLADVRATCASLVSPYGALYYPWVVVSHPTTGREVALPPSGFVAGIYARVALTRGVHKAPANEIVELAVDLESVVTEADQSMLDPEGINCLRRFRDRGIVVWGTRTLTKEPEWKYVNVRRLMLFLERSIDQGTQWAAFEPNDERTWAKVRRLVEDFLLVQWRAGALHGTKPEEAFFVKCDHTTMTQNDIDNGRLICLIGVAPVKPAEFELFGVSHLVHS